MRLATTFIALSLSVGLVASLPSTSHACGGFFCNAASQSPIFQSGERVAFFQHDDGQVTMHVEVSYAGNPTEFGWLIPVLTDSAEGTTSQLSDILGLSSMDFFRDLQEVTNPTWTAIQADPFPTDCDNASAVNGGGATGGGFSGCANFEMFPPSSNETFDDDEAPRLDSFVQDAAKVGPYDAQLIAAPKSSADLFDWLNSNGYAQDPAAKPLLAHYVSQGYKFIGIRLSNGKSSGDIRPIRLTLTEGGPCVPLRLTGIAATDNMPMRVWVFGPSRAIPKNFLHGVVNQQAVRHPGGGNYDAVVSRAVAEAGGRAFITEMSTSARLLDGLSLESSPPSDRALGVMAEMSWTDFHDTWLAYGLPNSGRDYRMFLNAHPWPIYAEDRSAWQAAFVQEVAKPLVELQRAMNASAQVTRFYTRLNPWDMTRDPIFSFNSDLPDVEQHHSLVVREFLGLDCNSQSILEWEDGRRFTQPAGVRGAQTIPNAPALLRAELSDETGVSLALHDDDIEAIDAVLDTAALGVPTLDEAQRAQLRLATQAASWPNKPDDFDEATNGAGGSPVPPLGGNAGNDDTDDSGCEINGRGVMAGYLVCAVLFLLAWRRRQRRSPAEGGVIA